MNKRAEHSGGQLKFAVDSQLLGELGEKLVTKNYIALSELLKNAYDADAANVTVRFINSSKGGEADNSGEIQLIDDGVGMTHEEVRSYWMRIATPNKVEKPISDTFGRPRTGSKGIGRFSCQRVSRHLVLTTTARVSRDQYETTQVEFNWSAFKPGTDLTEIPNKSIVTHTANGAGTTLRLVDLREPWTERDFTMLQRQVVMLTVQKGLRRNGYKEDPGLTVTLDAPEFPTGKGVLLENFMNAGWGQLKGRVDKKGKAHLFLEAPRLIGSKEYSPDKSYQLLSGLEWEIAFIPNEKDHFRNPKALTSGVAKTLQSFGGVRLYIDGFRVYPYGDPDDDWLGIDRDVARRKGSVDSTLLKKLATSLKLNSTRALLVYPRHRNLIGQVYLQSRPTSPFVVKMDREGLLDNDAYRQLVEFLRFSLDWMTLWYAAYLRRLAQQKRQAIEAEFRSGSKKAKDSSNLVDTALDLLVSKATAPVAESSTAKGGAQLVRQARDVVQARLTESDSELAVLRAVASTGPLMFAFAHEVKGVVGLLDTNAGQLESMASRLSKRDRTALLELSESLREASRHFGQLTKLFGIFTTAQKLTNRNVPVKAAVAQVVEGFGFIIGEFKINVDFSSISENLKTSPIVEAEFYSIVVNLLSNAIKASIAGRSSDIRISADKRQALVLRIQDKGVGLSKGRWEDVFEPLNPDPEERIYKQIATRLGDEELATLGRGTGLGLSIVRGIAQRYRGRAEFVPAPKGWRTCVQVELP